MTLGDLRHPPLRRWANIAVPAAPIILRDGRHFADGSTMFINQPLHRQRRPNRNIEDEFSAIASLVSL